MKRAIATPPGQETIYEDLSLEEANELEAQWSAPPPPPPLTTQLDAVFMTLPVEARAQFYPLKAAVKLAIEQGDLESAQLIIKMTQVPPELEPLKDAMLGRFNA